MIYLHILDDYYILNLPKTKPDNNNYIDIYNIWYFVEEIIWYCV